MKSDALTVCRGCGCRGFYEVETLRDLHPEDFDREDFDGQCDDCLESSGPDECCDFTEDTRDAEYERANAVWGETHGGHL